MKRIERQDELVEFVEEVCGIYIRTVFLPKGWRISQHVHDYDHATLIGQGKVALYVGGVMSGIFEAGKAVPILANQYHEFEALEDSRLSCIHEAKSADSMKAKGL